MLSLIGLSTPFDGLLEPLVSWLPPWLQPVKYVVLLAAGGTALFFGFYYLLALTFPKVAAIARTAAKEGTSQPLFWVELILGIVMIVLSIFIPYFTFGEDIKMMTDSGLTTILVLCVVLAVWTASVSIADEIEGKTALTLLSKPISRRQFVLGKFVGVLGPVYLMFLSLGIVFLISFVFKSGYYDPPESSREILGKQDAQDALLRVLPSMALVFLEAVVMSSISVAISTRLAMLPNLLICTSIYVLGHLTPLIVKSTQTAPLVQFVGKLIATILPVLENFDSQAAVAKAQIVPWSYVGVALAYSALYSTIAMLLALIMFEDRDLA